MSTYTLSKTTASFFKFHTPYSTLSLTPTGYIDIPFSTAVDAYPGSNAYTLVNAGKILGSVYLAGGGVVTNGSAAGPATTIAALYGNVVFIRGAVGTVTNYGSVTALGGGEGAGVYLGDGGLVTNGNGVDTAALIRASGGVFIDNATGVVNNFGTIVGTEVSGANACGLYLGDGGQITNGTSVDTAALIEGAGGIEVRSAAATVTNFGTVVGAGGENGGGVELVDGGTFSNGAVTDQNALVEGYSAGVTVQSVAGSVTNFGTIESRKAALEAIAVYLDTGVVTNGGAGDHAALISGYQGVELLGRGAITNFGSVLGVGGAGYGVLTAPGVTLTNGAVNDQDAVIKGYTGVEMYGVGVNFGAIHGTGESGTAGVALKGSAKLVNGAAADAKALIQGYAGAELAGTSVLDTFGTISGAGGIAVDLEGASATLEVEAHSAFIGEILGDGGALDLASGTGTLTGLVSSGSVLVSGSMAATTFSDFDTIEVGTGATFTVSGAVSIATGQSLLGAGALTINAGATTIANAGTVEAMSKGATVIDGVVQNTGELIAFGGDLTVEDAVTGAGSVRIGAGTADFVSTIAENVVFGGSGVLELSHSQTYTGEITGFSKTGSTSLDLVDIAFGSKTTAKFAGLTTSGVLTVTDGTHTAKITLEGDYVGSTFKVSSDGHGGTTVVDPTKPVVRSGPAPVVHPFIAAIAGFGARGVGIHVNPEPWRSSQSALASPRP